MKILIADDHSIVREGVKQLIRSLPLHAEVVEAGNGNEAFELFKKNSFDLIILDISLPGINGLDLLQRICSSGSDTRVLMLSFHPQEHYAIRAFRLGASGYVVKDSDPSVIQDAIERVAGGRRYVPPELAEALLFDTEEQSPKMPHESLSDREFQVMILLAQGQSVTGIASQVFISHKTVSTYRVRILKKMGFNSNAELTIYAMKNGLI